MAGRPRERLMVLELEQRTRLYFEDNEHTVLDFVCAWTAGGRTLTKLAREVSNKLDIEVGSEHITRWLYRKFDRAEAVARLAEAREDGAHAMVGEAIDDAEGVTHKDDAPIVRVRNDARFWTAQRYNRREFGEAKANVNLTLTVGSLHLDALRTRALKEQATDSAADARSLVCQNDTDEGSVAIPGAIDAEYEVLDSSKSST